MQGSVGHRGKLAMWRAIGVAALACTAMGVVYAQGPLTLYVAATDASGMPVTDLKAEEITMSENGMPGKIVSVEKFSLPIKLTIGIDNGPDSPNALSHYRTGLTELVKTLPPDIEVTLITMAPQPRMAVKGTLNREEVLRGITRFGPDEQPARFTDTLVEYAQRIDKEVKDKKLNYSPYLLMVSTTAAESSSYQRGDIEKAMATIAKSGARVSVAMTTTRVANADAQDDLNNGRQALIAIPLVKETRGRYEALAQSTRLQTLLPEIGKTIATIHSKQATQFKVTVERPNGATGPLNNLDMRLTRPGLNGSLSGDGRFFQ
jgi:hypothetical protein